MDLLQLNGSIPVSRRKGLKRLWLYSWCFWFYIFVTTFFNTCLKFCLITWSRTLLAFRRFFFAQWSAFWTLAVWIFKCHCDDCGHKLSDRLTVFLDRAEWRLWRKALRSFTVTVPRVESHATRESEWMLPKHTQIMWWCEWREALWSGQSSCCAYAAQARRQL
jgi:hypothetical protein